MYDINRKKKFMDITVKELIDALQDFPQDAKIEICGDSYCYIHVEENNSVVNLDNEELDECYENKRVKGLTVKDFISTVKQCNPDSEIIIHDVNNSTSRDISNIEIAGEELIINI